MKKYFAAAVVAVMVFAFAAFAASLNVNAGTLAAGQDDVGDCGGEALITYDHHWGFGGGPEAAYVQAFTITFDEDCSDNIALFHVDGPNDADGMVSVLISGDSVTIPVSNGNVDLTDWGGGEGVNVEDIESVNVTVFSHPSNPGQVPNPLYGDFAVGIFEGIADL
jgi:hypothetical protein